MSPTISSVTPLRAIEGGRVTLHGTAFPVDAVPRVTVGGQPALVAFASSSRLAIVVPADVEGDVPIRIAGSPGETAYLSVGQPWATGLHQVDSPAFDREGNLYVTYSGSPRGQETPVSVFRVTRAGTREPLVAGIVNATSLTLGPDGHLYVSSRFDGVVYRVGQDGAYEQVASNLGVACGIAFDAEGWLYVGDRSGTIFRVRDGAVHPFATLPSSPAAFHLAVSPHGELFVSAPTLSTYDHIYRLGRDGQVRSVLASFGRPQGLAFSPADGMLHVVDALAGHSGLYRLRDLDGEPELVVAGTGFVGVAFGPSGELAVSTADTVYRFT